MASTITTTDCAGFDLTDFGSPAAWQAVLDEFDLQSAELLTRDAYAWVAPGLRVITNANPLTGVREHRFQDDPGYASYMAVSGEPEMVRGFYDAVHDHAEYVKDSAMGESPYIKP